MCDIVTYNNIYLIFIPSLGTELLKSLEFPNQVIKGVFRYANEVKFGKSMGPIRMGAGCQGNLRPLKVKKLTQDHNGGGVPMMGQWKRTPL